jgi:FkbM family methyltransferase
LKQALKNWLPGPAARVAHFKALFENEIELRLLPFLCDRRRTSVDVGCFTGTWAIGMLLHSARVIAVEPQPRQAAALRRAMPARVTVVEAALSDAPREAWMEMDSIEGGSMSRVTLDGTVEDGRIASPVRLMRLDDVADGPVGFVKIDAEGHEAAVLRGGRDVIRHSRPAFVIEAEERCHPRAVGEVIDELAPFDYAGFFVYRGVLKPIAEFDPVAHQDLALLLGGRRRDYQDYINNFIFLPREHAGLPAVVPSPRAAAVESLKAWAGLLS